MIVSYLKMDAGNLVASFDDPKWFTGLTLSRNSGLHHIIKVSSKPWAHGFGYITERLHQMERVNKRDRPNDP